MSTRAVVFASCGVLALIALGVVVLFPWKRLWDGSLVHSLMPRGPTHSGWSAEWAGDLDGDGKPDILLCTPFEPGRGRNGCVRAFSGATGTCLLTIAGAQEFAPGYRLVVSAGDVDGDSLGDLLYANFESTCALSGRSGAVLHCVPDDWAYSMAPAGDIDRDGRADWLRGAPLDGPRAPNYGGHYGDTSGFVQLTSGRTGEAIWELRGQRGDVLGWRVGGVGDTDGDEVDDFVVTKNSDQYDRYTAVVFSGASLEPLRELPFPRGQYREGLAPAGDVDADSHQDILLGAHSVRSGGAVRVYSGKDGSILLDVQRDTFRFATLMEGVGDVDADGHADISVGSWHDAVVFSGRTSEVLRELPGACLGFGRGDLDGDGHADLLITRNVVLTEQDPIEAAWDKGTLEVISGRDGSVLRTITGRDVLALRER